jgi:hypothetical protein
MTKLFLVLLVTLATSNMSFAQTSVHILPESEIDCSEDTLESLETEYDQAQTNLLAAHQKYVHETTVLYAKERALAICQYQNHNCDLEEFELRIQELHMKRLRKKIKDLEAIRGEIVDRISDFIFGCTNDDAQDL